MLHMKAKKTVTIALLSLFAIGVAGSAMADSDFAKDHPRRAEVNHRLNNQNERIHNEVKSGEISKGEAAKLHKEDRHIRKEERGMASRNDGHITKQEQHKLNRQENSVSNQIGK